MGTNKLPGIGHTQFSPQPQKDKTKIPPNVKQAGDDASSVRTIALKYSAGKEEQLAKIKLSGGDKPKIPSPKTTNSYGSYVAPSIDWQTKDVVTGETFSVLAKKSFEKGRPYCFAVAISTNEKTSEKKKFFMDGAEFLQSMDVESFKMPCRVRFGSEEEVKLLRDVQFFAARENNQIEKIGSIGETMHGTESTMLRYLIKQEDDDTYDNVGCVTDVVIASAYFLGIGVRKDEEYAKKIISKFNREEKSEISPDVFSFALVNMKDTRMTEFLLDSGFDPSVRHPYDLGTSMQSADYHGSKETLRVFERYGYRLENE